MLFNLRGKVDNETMASIAVIAFSCSALLLIQPGFTWATVAIVGCVALVIGLQTFRQRRISYLRRIGLSDSSGAMPVRPVYLTGTQATSACRYAAKWRRVFFSTTAANREKCQMAAESLYAECGLAAPSFVWLDSPFQAVVARMILAFNGHPAGGAGAPARFPLTLSGQPHVAGSGKEFSFHKSAMAEVDNEVSRMNMIRTLAVNKLLRDLRSNPASVWAVWNLVYEKMMEQAPELFLNPGEFGPAQENGVAPAEWMREYEHYLHSAARLAIESGAWSMGRHGAPEMLEWELAYRWRSKELGVKYDLPPGTMEIAKAQNVLAHNVGWWMPLERLVIFTEGPVATRIDENGRLSAEGGPAMEFGDGWSVHAVNGVLVSAEWSAQTPERWKLEWALRYGNVEERRVLLERIDYERLLREENRATLIHQQDQMRMYKIEPQRDVDNDFGLLDSEPIMLLRLVDPSTGSAYVLRVPPEMNTCEQARRWTLHDETGDVEFVKET